MMKYKSINELIAAYDSGELSNEDALILDNDSCSVYIIDPQDDDTFIKVFDGGDPLDLLCKALTMLGIPHQQA